MPQIPWILGITAALLHGAGYVIYNVQAKKGDSKPNIVSWFIWALMAGLNATSFSGVTDIPHALQYMVGTFAAILTFVLALRWRRFDWPETIELVILVLCLASMAMWYGFKDASFANAIVLVPFLISFWPTWRGVRENPRNEKPLAWNMWSLAFAVNLTNNLVTWNGKWMSIINPLILLLCHWSIVYLSRTRTNR